MQKIKFYGIGGQGADTEVVVAVFLEEAAVVLDVDADPELPAELERNFRISDEILRYLVVKVEK